MRLEERFAPEVLRAEVNWFISICFIASFALGAGLILWKAAFGHNPLADTLANALYEQREALK